MTGTRCSVFNYAKIDTYYLERFKEQLNELRNNLSNSIIAFFDLHPSEEDTIIAFFDLHPSEEDTSPRSTARTYKMFPVLSAFVAALALWRLLSNGGSFC